MAAPPVDICMYKSLACMMRTLSFSGFDWDAGNRQKCLKHGVAREDIESLFMRNVSVFPDPVHSGQETRYLAIGKTGKGRHVFLAFTIRQRAGTSLIRPISARFMHRKEIAHYEKETAKAAKR